MNTRNLSITFEEGWPVIQQGIDKLIGIIEGVNTEQFTSDEYLNIYSACYNICTADPCGPEAENLYARYRQTFEDYITSKVLPSLRGKKDESLLQELLHRWNNHRVMVKWLFRFFNYINRYFVNIKLHSSLEQTSHLIFYELVYGEINDQVRDVVIYMIGREREGEQLDQDLVKNVVDIYVEMAEDSMKYYQKDFEKSFLKDTAAFYSARATDWIASLSYEDYMVKVEECLNRERERVSRYLRFRSKYLLEEVIQNELINAHTSKIEAKKQLMSS